MSMKCVECNKPAEYVYFGKTLCGKHRGELQGQINKVEAKQTKEALAKIRGRS